MKTLFAIVLLGWTCAASASPEAEHWVALDSALHAALPGWNIRPQEAPTPSRQARRDGYRVVRLDAGQLESLAAQVHKAQRHGGFSVHASREDAEGQRPVQRRSRYAIAQDARLQPWLRDVDETRLVQTIEQLSLRPDRRHRSAHGAEASAEVMTMWRALIARRPEADLSLIEHRRTPQRSVMLTLPGRTHAREIVVLGAHLDSESNTSRAPGADDDASGVACLTEVIRILLEHDYVPERTLQFIAYAGEEGGLLGSEEIARAHRDEQQDVLGVLQLDMTNYQGSPGDIHLVEDNTDNAQNDFLRELVEHYQPDLTVQATRCGYACSDHASWHRYGYAASFPFEAQFSQFNRAIHTDRDTLAASHGRATHSVKFARLALSYAVELGSQTGSVTALTLP